MAQNITRGIKELLTEANKVVPTVSIDEAQALLQDGNTVFVDIRDIRELQRDGKIPGAVSCPRGMLEFWIDPESPYHKEVFNQDKHYILYCASAWRSALTGKVAIEMGLAPVSHLEGGFMAWSKAGAPIEKVERREKA
ncbi:MAG: rhodanese-like domain-containing protein [Granulosicoccaceae bacterium]